VLSVLLGPAHSAFAFHFVYVRFGLRSAPTHDNHSLAPGPISGDRLKVVVLLLGICFLREALERAIGTDRRAGKWGLVVVQMEECLRQRVDLRDGWPGGGSAGLFDYGFGKWRRGRMGGAHSRADGDISVPEGAGSGVERGEPRRREGAKVSGILGTTNLLNFTKRYSVCHNL
jgi:hypothetical protein